MDHDLELLWVAAPLIGTEGIRDLLIECSRMRSTIREARRQQRPPTQNEVVLATLDLRNVITIPVSGSA